MFNPFGALTMEKVVANIVAHANKSGTTIYLIYCMPSFESVFIGMSSFVKILEIYNKGKTQKELSVFKIIPADYSFSFS